MVQAEVCGVGEGTGGKGDVAAGAGADWSQFLPRGKICNDRAEKTGGRMRVGVKSVLSDGQDPVLIQLRRVLVVLCTV